MALKALVVNAQTVFCEAASLSALCLLVLIPGLCSYSVVVKSMDFGAKLPGFESWLCCVTWRNYAQFPPQCCRDDSSTLVIKTVTEIK